MTNEFIFDNVIKSVGNSVEFLTEKDNYTLSLSIMQGDIENGCVAYLSISDVSTVLILFSKSFPSSQTRLTLDKKLGKHTTREERYNDSFDITPEKIFESTIYLGAYTNELSDSMPKEMIDQAYEILMALYNNKSLKLTGKEKQCTEKIFIDILL